MIAKEGKTILITLFVFTLVSRWIATTFESSWLSFGYIVFGVLFLFSLNFFRDPRRRVPKDENLIISPADGKIVKIDSINDPEVGKAKSVSIFLNVFNVHVNRVPFAGTVLRIEHKSGKFLAAFDHKASDENEQAITVFETSFGKMKVKQIAGLIARRIHCYAKPNYSMQKGEKLGFIMFGSRTDIIFPESIELQVELGQKVKGNETIIGHIV
ncbi:MAG: phosphatidylserine decarboxylase family protein [Candidatus Marinimicrobia bacterium]|nr:phosphatidylserine decarboxylase family protein [Candidatus Neomarinimicrobiota bacterium]MBL7059391.1 phosphatidylserine decarboxylase family protein [Candidatus Neomarinimicrobiota bacterium]